MIWRALPAAFVCGLALIAPQGRAADYPSRPIKLIVPYAAGGPSDVQARMIGEYLGRDLKQAVIVENKAGAQGMVGAELAKNAAPDGYTFVYVNSSMMCINPYVYKKLPYDGFKDFVPVTQHGLAPLVMVTPPSLGLTVTAQPVWSPSVTVHATPVGISVENAEPLVESDRSRLTSWS